MEHQIGAAKLTTTKLDEKIEFLKSFSLFAELSSSELAGLSHVMEELELAPGIVLLKQNENADAVYFLKSGAVKILVNDEMVAQIDQPQCFGEMSCLTPNTPTSASVVTAKKSQLMRIAKGDFLAAANQLSSIWKMLFVQMSERVRTANGRLSEILQHLPQGLVKVSPIGVISNDYSVQVTKFFERENIAGSSFPELAFPGDEAKQKMWLENLSLLFAETNMSFESCASLLTSDFTLQSSSGTRYFTMSYAPCKSLVGKIIAVDIGIEDITNEKELERKHYEAKLKQAMVNKISQSPDSYINFLAFCDEIALETETFIRDLVRGARITERVDGLMRQLHSLKGIAGLFSLQDLKSNVHETESMVSRLKNASESTAVVAESLGSRIGIVKSEIGKARKVFDDLPPDLRRRLTGVVVSPQEFDSLKVFVESADLAAVRRLLASVEKIDSKKLVANWPQESQQISESLGKEMNFNVVGEGGRIARDTFTQLDQVLVHLLRNAIDHGLEMPDVREEKGKSRVGRITAMIDVSDSEFIMAIEDDGRGLDRAALAKRAREKANLDQALVEAYVAEGAEWKILLLPGFSTAAAVTDLSGRGVGLDAVASAIAQLGGQFTIESTLGEGTAFLITIPLSVAVTL